MTGQSRNFPEKKAIQILESQLAQDVSWLPAIYEVIRTQFKHNYEHRWSKSKQPLVMTDPILRAMDNACYADVCQSRKKRGIPLKKLIRQWHLVLAHIYSIGMLMAAAEDLLTRFATTEGGLTAVDIVCIREGVELFYAPSVNWVLQKEIEAAPLETSVEEVYVEARLKLEGFYGTLHKQSDMCYDPSQEEALVSALKALRDIPWTQVLPSRLQDPSYDPIELGTGSKAMNDLSNTTMMSLPLDSIPSFRSNRPPAIIIGSHYAFQNDDLDHNTVSLASTPASSHRLSIFSTGSRSRATSVSSVRSNRSRHSRVIESAKELGRKGKAVCARAISRARSQTDTPVPPLSPEYSETSDPMSSLGSQFPDSPSSIPPGALTADSLNNEYREGKPRRLSTGSQASETSEGTIKPNDWMSSSGILGIPLATEPFPEYSEDYPATFDI
jgi:hypothetical protein